MLNAYGSNFKKFLNKSQLLFSAGVWFLIDGFFDSPRVKEAISFYIHDELDLLDQGANHGK
jgi:hypothetical protein